MDLLLSLSNRYYERYRTCLGGRNTLNRFKWSEFLYLGQFSRQPGLPPTRDPYWAPMWSHRSDAKSARGVYTETPVHVTLNFYA